MIGRRCFSQDKRQLVLRFVPFHAAIQFNINGLPFEFRIQRGQSRNHVFREPKILGVKFQAGGDVTDRIRGGDGRAGTHEWVENRSFAQRQKRAHDDAHEVLRFETGMV